MQEHTQIQEEETLTIKKQNEQLSAAISHALEMEKLFKLYSYRIIGHAQFIEFVENTIQDTNKLIK